MGRSQPSIYCVDRLAASKHMLPPGQCGYSETLQTAMIVAMAWYMVVWLLQICRRSDFVSFTALRTPPVPQLGRGNSRKNKFRNFFF